MFSFAASAAEREVLSGGVPVTYTVLIEPGQLFTFNFLVGSNGSKLAAKFETDGPPIVPSVFAHPRSEITRQDETVALDCPGLENHPLKVSPAAEPSAVGTINSSPNEDGHFGFAFHNTGDTPAGVRLMIVSSENIAITIVGLRPGEAVPLVPRDSTPPEASRSTFASTAPAPPRARFYASSQPTGHGS